jgi:hypothetical protein
MIELVSAYRLANCRLSSEKEHILKLATLRYSASKGWEAPFPALDSPQTLVIVFGATSFLDQPDPIRELTRAYPTSHIVGCSTAGEILGTEITDESLVVAVTRFSATTLASVVQPIQDASASYQVGVDIAQQLSGANLNLKGVIVLSEGTIVNGSQLVAGVNSVLPPAVVITGGLAGDGPRFERTWIIKDGKPQAGYVSAVGLYGDHIHLGHGSKGGWDTYEKEYWITKSKNNVLYEINGKPALQLYKEYLKERAAELPASALLFPLALRAKPGATKQIVRTVLGVDEAAQSMTFAGDMPQGYLAQFMRANFDGLIQGAESAALMTEASTNRTATLMVAISCVGRRLVLKERTHEELEMVSNTLPDFAKQIGFYSYGEISPYASGACELHNQTMTLTAISEPGFND